MDKAPAPTPARPGTISPGQGIHTRSLRPYRPLDIPAHLLRRTSPAETRSRWGVTERGGRTRTPEAVRWALNIPAIRVCLTRCTEVWAPRRSSIRSRISLRTSRQRRRGGPAVGSAPRTFTGALSTWRFATLPRPWRESRGCRDRKGCRVRRGPAAEPHNRGIPADPGPSPRRVPSGRSATGSSRYPRADSNPVRDETGVSRNSTRGPSS